MTMAIARVIEVTPQPKHPGWVFLTVICPFCGEEHWHGNPAALDESGPTKGTYGTRASDCTDWHTHMVSPRTGKRMRVTEKNRCRERHLDIYLVAPADYVAVTSKSVAGQQ